MPSASSTRPTVAARELDELLVDDPDRLAARGVEPVLPAGVPPVQLVDEVLDGTEVVLGPRAG